MSRKTYACKYGFDENGVICQEYEDENHKIVRTPVSKLGYVKATEFDIVCDFREIYVVTEKFPKKVKTYFKKHLQIKIRDDIENEFWFLRWMDNKLFIVNLNGVVYPYGFTSDQQVLTVEGDEEQITEQEANDIYKKLGRWAVFRKQNRFGIDVPEAQGTYKKEIVNPDDEQR
jgi:hypothetical protein